MSRGRAGTRASRVETVPQWPELSHRFFRGEESRKPLKPAYQLAKENDGAPGIDGVTSQAIEAEGLKRFLEQLREELVQRSYRPQRLGKVGIPKEGGKVRQLSIPSIRDRVVQGALKLILEPIFEADFQRGSYGYRPKKSAHAAIQRVSEAIVRHMTYVVDLDLRSYFDTVRHHIVLEKVARRVNDSKVLWLLRLLLKASGTQGVPQSRVISPLRSNVYLKEVDNAGKGEGSHPPGTMEESRVGQVRR